MTPERIWIHPADSLQLYVTQEMPDAIGYRRDSYVADLERRLSEAVELIAKLRAGVERYSSDLCREADTFLDEAFLTDEQEDK